MRRRLRLLALESPDAAELAAQALPLEDLPTFTIFGAYRAQGAEMDPAPVIGRLTDAGAALSLPAATARDAPLDYRMTQAGQTLVLDAFGIPAPPPNAPPVAPQLILAPVLAFDAKGGRLGQGAGAFDRTLQALRAAGPLFVVGLAYAGQEVDHAAFDDHDEPLDAILTERGYKVFPKET